MSQPPFQPHEGTPAEPSYPPSGYPPPPSTYPAPAQPGYPSSAPPGYPPQPQPGYPPAQPSPGYPPAYPGGPTTGAAPTAQFPAYQGGAQPAYPPSYPVPGAPTPTTGRSNAAMIIGIVVVVLLLGAGGGLYFILKDNKSTTTPTANSTSAASATTAASVPTSATQLVAPPKLLGRPPATDPSITAAMDSAKTELNGQLTRTTSTIAAAYGGVSTQDLIMVIGASGQVGNPGIEVASALTSFSSSAGVSPQPTPVSVDPGPLGGVAKCVDTKISGIDLAVCAWGDSDSLGLVIFYFKKVTAVTNDFVTARNAIEQRG